MDLKNNQILKVRLLPNSENPETLEFELITVVGIVTYSIKYHVAEQLSHRFMAELYLESILLFLSKKTENVLL